MSMLPETASKKYLFTGEHIYFWLLSFHNSDAFMDRRLDYFSQFSHNPWDEHESAIKFDTSPLELRNLMVKFGYFGKSIY